MRRLALVALVLAGCNGTVEQPSSSSSSGTGASGTTHGATSGTSSSTSATTGTGSTTGTSGSSTTSTSTTGSSGSNGSGDTYLPWEGGPSYYTQWSHGPSSDPSFFPIAVWLQSPSNAGAYQALGVNTFIGLWDGPTDQQLSDLTSAHMPTLCDQDVDWASHLDDPIVTGWTQQDEPDNAQALPDGGGYGPCIDPSVIQQIGNTYRQNDSTRPVFLNTGQGTAWADYYGRGSACAGVDDYAQYALGADILSFDIYPVNSTDAPVQGKLEMVAAGVDHLRTASNNEKAVWTWIETTGFNDPSATPTPDQIRTEVWMVLVHGARGFGYFCHIFSPSFDETGLLDTPASSQAVTDIDAQIQQLAPVLNQPSLANGATVQSSDANVPIDIMAKRYQGTLYVFAVNMRPTAADGTFTIRTPTSGSITAMGESRTIDLSGGTFTDHFDGYAVHLYQFGP